MRSCLNTGNCGLLGEAKHITIRQCFARGGAVRERLFSGKMFSRFLRRTRLSKASAMQRKGKPTDRGDISRRIKNVNAMQAERDAKDRSIADEEEKLSEPPRSPQDERERSAAVTAAGDRAMRVKTKRPDPLKWDGFQPWQRPAPVPAAVRPARPQRVGD